MLSSESAQAALTPPTTMPSLDTNQVSRTRQAVEIPFLATQLDIPTRPAISTPSSAQLRAATTRLGKRIHFSATAQALSIYRGTTILLSADKPDSTTRRTAIHSSVTLPERITQPARAMHSSVSARAMAIRPAAQILFLAAGQALSTPLGFKTHSWEVARETAIRRAAATHWLAQVRMSMRIISPTRPPSAQTRLSRKAIL